ncbi:MAG TPA: DUF2066 domain-containing protein [Gammaproteobacteria bacterium]|nr:DUF2066 domain-containing protein [Gammaproteobacteria bacterium]
MPFLIAPRLTRLLLATVLYALAGIASLSAVEVRDLYEAEVPVADKSEAAREAGLGDALLRVIGKVSGLRGTRSEPTVARAVENPGRFVQQFRYRQAPASDAAASQAPEQRWRLWARFDARVVDGLVRDAGLRVWGRVRPAVMVWVAVDQSGTRRILGGEEAPELAAVIRDAARQRGVPVVMPLLDLEDQGRLRVSDVWGGFRDRIQQASGRYQSNVIFTGRVYRLLPTLWEGRFSLIAGDTVEEWSNQGDILELLLADAVNAVADRLALRFAGPTGTAGAYGFGVIVSGVRSVGDYARALDYLSTLEQITDVSVTRVSADEVRFFVETRGGQDALLKVVSLGGTLAQESLPGDPELRFRLLP